MRSGLRSRGYLPHLEDNKAIYFVTFRLVDSLPQELVVRLREERERLQRARRADTATAGDSVREQELRNLLRKAERTLDCNLGCCYMLDGRVARLIADALRHFHGKHYELFAWCVMPNHVHVMFSPFDEYSLDSVLHSWKSYTALKANALLKRIGRFWQREYFDHLVRSESSFRKISQYIRDNPRRAGLVDWPWVEVL
jgi:REP element-mobilizing transposase RayT